MAGHVVILNGTSSVGKTTLAGRVHDLADEPWVDLDQDGFTKSLLPNWVRKGEVGMNDDFEGFSFLRAPDGSVHVEAGSLGQQVLAGYRRAVAALARSGLNVVVAESKFDPTGWEDWAEALQGLRPLWVSVHCSLQECQRRERERADRVQGLAAGHYDLVHSGAIYELEVDLTDSQLDEAALEILIASKRTGSA